MRHFIYLIAVDDMDFGPVKVGISGDVPKRVRNLQTASPFELKLIHQFELPDISVAAYMERCFHDLETESRLHGEWFALDPLTALQKLTICVAGLFIMHFENTKPEYIANSLKLSGVHEANIKIESWIRRS